MIINLLLHSLGILLGRVQIESTYSITSIRELNIALQELNKCPFTKKGYICLHFVPFAKAPVHSSFHELLMNHCEQTGEKGNKTCKIKPLDFCSLGVTRIQLGELKTTHKDMGMVAKIACIYLFGFPRRACKQLLVYQSCSLQTC